MMWRHRVSPILSTRHVNACRSICIPLRVAEASHSGQIVRSRKTFVGSIFFFGSPIQWMIVTFWLTALCRKTHINRIVNFVLAVRRAVRLDSHPFHDYESLEQKISVYYFYCHRWFPESRPRSPLHLLVTFMAFCERGRLHDKCDIHWNRFHLDRLDQNTFDLILLFRTPLRW